MEIIAKNITKEFKKEKVLDSVNLTFESGKIYSLIGRNGSGKTVFLKILCGLYYPTDGTITFDGIDYSVNGEFPKNVGALIEHPSFIDNLTGFENLKLLAEIQNKISGEKIIDTLKLVNLYEEKDKTYSKYSLGMKQKLGIAQAIMEDNDVIILDEPFNGLEEETADKLRKLLVELKEQGKIIILSTHIKEDIDMITDIIYKFENGKVVKVN